MTVLMRPDGDPAALRVDPADLPALEIKLVALVVLLSVTLLSGFVPLCVVRPGGRCGADPERRRRLLALISCFSGGVFMATCLLDLLPDFLQSIGEAFRDAGIKLQFPLPEFIVAMGFFLVLVLEQIVLAFKDQAPPQLEERRALVTDSDAPAAGGPAQRRRGSAEPAGPLHGAPGAQPALRAFVLVFSLSLHSVLEGLAVGLLPRGQEVLQVCLALLIHKSVIAFSLSAALSQGRLRRAVVSGGLLAFAVMSPLGIALGVALTESRMSPQHRLARCTLQGLAAGSFLYITFMEILPPELAAGRGRVPKVAMMLLGFAAVTGVLFVKL
ncbi:zinc transporter ZIP1 [Poecilia reticulata]|uniref:Solute carrier family 39 member 1 n=1 Tax=Poecilia reticulata TaxID=8081 RepID=A0A3P9PJG7_POERE|nr:PREDICTED: zinc transporter ZIP1 [Poecilia reticulata]